MTSLRSRNRRKSDCIFSESGTALTANDAKASSGKGEFGTTAVRPTFFTLPLDPTRRMSPVRSCFAGLIDLVMRYLILKLIVSPRIFGMAITGTPSAASSAFRQEIPRTNWHAFPSRPEPHCSGKSINCRVLQRVSKLRENRIEFGVQPRGLVRQCGQVVENLAQSTVNKLIVRYDVPRW